MIYDPDTHCLDTMTRQELDAIARNENNFFDIRNYADAKSMAMSLRLSGNVADAMRLEVTCERIYNRLPESLKW